MTARIRRGLEDDASLRCERHELENGLVVLLHPDPDLPDVTLEICYRAGAKDDDPGGSGMAHMVEHLMFAGSGNLGGPFTDAMRQAGIFGANAFTTHDQTCYFLSLPPEALAFALFAEADRMESLPHTVTDAILAAEKAIILEEKAQTGSDAASLTQELVRDAIFPVGHPYRRIVIGSVADISAMTTEAVRDWHRRYYAPDNAILMIAGPIDPGAALDLVRTYFAPLPHSGRVRPASTWIPAPGGRRQTLLDAPSGEGHLVHLVWPGPEARSDAATRMTMLAGYLGHDEQSPLYRSLVATGYASDLIVTFQPGMVCGQFLVAARLGKDSDLSRLADAMKAAVANAIRSPGDDLQLERVRRLQEAELERATDDVEHRVQLFLDGELHARDPFRFLDELSAIRALDMTTLMAEARRWLSDEPFVLMVRALDPRTSPAMALEKPPRPPLPIIDAAIPEATLETEALANGLQLVTIPAMGTNAFVLRLELGRGPDDEPERGLTGLVASLPLHAAGPFGLGSIGEEAGQSGISVEIGTRATDLWVEISGPGSQEAAALGMRLLHALVLEPRFDAGVLQELGGARRNPDLTGEDAVLTEVLSQQRRRLYGKDSPEVRTWEASDAVLASVDPGMLTAWHKTLFDPTTAILLVTAPDQRVPRLVSAARDLGELWKPPAEPRPAAPSSVFTLPLRNREEVRLYPHGPVEQALVVMGVLLPQAGGPRQREIAAAMAVLLQGRLAARLREDLNWTYGVEVDIAWPRAEDLPPILTVRTFVKAAHAAEAISEIRAVCGALLTTAPPAELEIDAYRTSLRQGLARLRRAPRDLLAMVGRAIRRGHRRPFAARLDPAAALSPEAIMACLHAALSASPVDWVIASRAPRLSVTSASTGLPVIIETDR
jgi:zinc protease